MGFRTMISLAVLLVPSVLLADEDVSPPPVHPVDAGDRHERPARPSSELSAPENGVDLKEELVPKSLGKDVQVRSYIRKSDRAEITEYSRNGRVYMIKVDPAGDAPPYYLYDEDGDGQFQRRLPGGYRHLNPPGWEVKKF